MTKTFCDVCEGEIKSGDTSYDFRLGNIYGVLCNKCAAGVLDIIERREEFGQKEAGNQ